MTDDIRVAFDALRADLDDLRGDIAALDRAHQLTVAVAHNAADKADAGIEMAATLYTTVDTKFRELEATINQVIREQIAKHP